MGLGRGNFDCVLGDAPMHLFHLLAPIQVQQKDVVRLLFLDIFCLYSSPRIVISPYYEYYCICTLFCTASSAIILAMDFVEMG